MCDWIYTNINSIDIIYRLHIQKYIYIIFCVTSCVKYLQSWLSLPDLRLGGSQDQSTELALALERIKALEAQVLAAGSSASEPGTLRRSAPLTVASLDAAEVWFCG